MALRSKFTVFEFQRGLLYHYGKLDSVLAGGKHVRWGSGWTIALVDMRQRLETIGTQEILTQDGIAVKLSAACIYSVSDPRKAMESVESYREAAYLTVQLALRDAVTGMTADDLLAHREDIGGSCTAACVQPFADLGLTLTKVELRDITLPGDLKRIFAQVALAQKEALASLERARGEAASLRSLANAAKLLEGNPALMQLRILQSLAETKGATIVLNATDSQVLPTKS